MMMNGTIMEPRAMAQFHLARALKFTSREDIAQRVALSPATVSAIQYGGTDYVKAGLTKHLKRIADKLEEAGENVNPWKEFLDSPEGREEVQKGRAPHKRLPEIRSRMAKKEVSK